MESHLEREIREYASKVGLDPNGPDADGAVAVAQVAVENGLSTDEALMEARKRLDKAANEPDGDSTHSDQPDEG